MTTIDIRKQKEPIVDAIIFADTAAFAATKLVKARGYVFLASKYTEASDIATKQDAHNLIKALQKAIELGWWA